MLLKHSFQWAGGRGGSKTCRFSYSTSTALAPRVRMCALARRAALVCKANTVCMFARLTQTDCRGAVLCRVHYLIRVNFPNNPLLARVDHALQGGWGRRSRESYYFSAAPSQLFPSTSDPRTCCCVYTEKDAAPLNGRERENKTLHGVAPVFKL